MSASAQPSLWDLPAPPRPRRRRMARTSLDAFDDLQDRRHSTRQRVLDALRQHGPMTRHEVASVTGLPLSSVCGRVNELVERGLVQGRIVGGRQVRREKREVVEATFTTGRTG